MIDTFRLALTGTLTYVFLYHSTTVIAYPASDPHHAARCPRKCIDGFSSHVGETTFGEGKSLMSMQWRDLIAMSHKVRDATELRRRLEDTCVAYDTLRTCLRDCRSSEIITDAIVQGFESLKLLCYEKKQEFLDYVPCLAKYEETVINQCHGQMNRSIQGTQMLNNAIRNHDNGHQLPVYLSNVCAATNDLVSCMEHPTFVSCGSREPVILMRQLVALAFKNFEKLYATLGLDQPLPDSCVQLITTAGTSQGTSPYVMMSSGWTADAAYNTHNGYGNEYGNNYWDHSSRSTNSWYPTSGNSPYSDSANSTVKLTALTALNFYLIFIVTAVLVLISRRWN